jgi:hypothetical protein
MMLPRLCSSTSMLGGEFPVAQLALRLASIAMTLENETKDAASARMRGRC